jgi:hypothetical protein
MGTKNGCTRPSDALDVRLRVFTSDEFMDELATASVAVGKWRHALVLFDDGRGEGSYKDVTDAQREAGKQLGHMRLLARGEIRDPPHIAERRTQFLLNAMKGQRESTHG